MALVPGRYLARAGGQVVLGMSRTKGTPFIELYFTVSQGEYKGEQVRWTSYMSDTTVERTLESLEFCGWVGDDLSAFGDGCIHGLDKNEVQIVVEAESYRDAHGAEKKALRVAWVNKVGYLNTAAAMSEDQAAAFGARMRDVVAAHRARKSRPAPEQAPASHQDADEIPF